MASADTLQIRGLGLFLPPARRVKELVAEAGGDPERHDGWEHTCVGGPDDHPSTMGFTALRAALDEAQLPPEDLDLVLSIGVSRDYAGSWLVSTELMKRVGASDRCLGFDLAIGCLSSLVALNTALGWLRTLGGGHAAIVTAERWTQTIDRSAPGMQPLWAHADGSGALIVSLDRPGRSLGTFHGAVFNTHHAFNDLVVQRYGGTRAPWAPDAATQVRRTFSPTAQPSEIWAVYSGGYARAATALRERFGVVPNQLTCNQISPKIVTMIIEAFGIDPARAYRSGESYGHVGGADVLIGLRRFFDLGLESPIAVAASAPFAFGAGLVTRSDGELR